MPVFSPSVSFATMLKKEAGSRRERESDAKKIPAGKRVRESENERERTCVCVLVCKYERTSRWTHTGGALCVCAVRAEGRENLNGNR